MSLEDAIRDNTAAVRDLIHALGAARQGVKTEAPGKPAQKETAAHTPPTVSAPPAAAPEPKDEPSASATDSASNKTLDYEADVKPLILKIGREKGRETAISFLKSFGVATGTELKPEQWAAVVAKASEVLGS